MTQDHAVAFLTRTGAWRVALHGLTMRPLIESGLRVCTALVTRADNDSRLLSDFVSSAMRKLRANTVPRQEELPLTG